MNVTGLPSRIYTLSMNMGSTNGQEFTETPLHDSTSAILLATRPRPVLTLTLSIPLEYTWSTPARALVAEPVK